MKAWFGLPPSKPPSMMEIMIAIMRNPAASPENVALAADVIAFDARFRLRIEQLKQSGEVNEATTLHAYKNADAYVEECRVAEMSFRAGQDNEKLASVLKNIIGKLSPQTTTARSLIDVMIDVLGNKMAGSDIHILATEVVAAYARFNQRALRAKGNKEFSQDYWIEMFDLMDVVHVQCEDAERIFSRDNNSESLRDVLKEAKEKLDTMFVRIRSRSDDVA